MFRQVELPDGVPGTLYLHSMPGRYEDWPTFLAEVERSRLDLIACLASASEIQAKSPSYGQARLAKLLPCEFRDFPTPDFGVPPMERLAAFKDFVTGLGAELNGGATLLVHCAAGIGRTGIVATCLLLQLGVEREDAVRRVAVAGSGSEVPEQKELIVWYATSLSPT